MLRPRSLPCSDRAGARWRNARDPPRPSGRIWSGSFMPLGSRLSPCVAPMPCILTTGLSGATILGGLAEALGRSLANLRGLDDAALARIDGPEGQACLAMAPEPLARWED